MPDLTGYDDYKLAAPEPSDFQKWLDILTPDDVADICYGPIIDMWMKNDDVVIDILRRHFENLHEE